MKNEKKRSFNFRHSGYFPIFFLLCIGLCLVGYLFSYQSKLQIARTKIDKKDQLLKKVEIPKYVLEVYHYIRENGKAPNQYVGGRNFQNREKKLPQKSNKGQSIKYREWDVHPYITGKDRGPERLVTGSNQTAYYTFDHYSTFIPIE
ncbi:MAG: ribonuclease [Saprospiraceae bacterium]|nr:ribonuclease [Saprospiraceae bacterium]